MTQREDAPPNIAIFADFENVALGVRDANFEPFDINMVIERLLDKGKIVVKKAYADWDRYKSHKRSMHEAAFELVEIPHVSYSGKNSADIRLVVDALDLCYTKHHIDIFVIVSGDSDFSPLVSKLREMDKKVIGLGVKNSSSDLLVDNCDEFIYYDDLIRSIRKGKKPGAKRESPRAEPARAKPPVKAPAKPAAARQDGQAKPDAAKPDSAAVSPTTPAAPAPEADTKSVDERREEAIEMVLDVVESLFRERDDNLWGSMVKQTLKRKKPNFSETFHGYRTFNELIEDAQRRGLLETQKDERSGGYLILSFGPNA